MRGVTTTNSPTNPRVNPKTARAFKRSFRYLAAKRLTNTGCKLTISAATPAGMPLLTAKKQPPKYAPCRVSPISVDGQIMARVNGWLFRRNEIAIKSSSAAIAMRIAMK